MGGLSVSSHAEAHVALFYVKGFSAEKAQVFNSSSKHKNIANFPTSAWIVKAKTLQKIKGGGGVQCNYAICGSAHVSVWFF